MKKSSKSSLIKRSLDISLQHKNEATYKFSKKKFCTWPNLGVALKGLSTHKDTFVVRIWISHLHLYTPIYLMCELSRMKKFK